MDMYRSLAVAASGLKAQAGRMRVIAENIANASSVAKVPGGDPYQRRITSFKTEFDRQSDARLVAMAKTQPDRTDFPTRFEPGHPMADAKGYVKYPNVDPLVETIDMKEAQRSYEANLNVVSATRRMLQRTLDLLRA